MAVSPLASHTSLNSGVDEVTEDEVAEDEVAEENIGSAAFITPTGTNWSVVNVPERKTKID